MKKFVLFAAVAGVALAGCAKVEKTVTGEPGNVPIVFEPVANNLATKAVYYGEQNATYTGDGDDFENFRAWGFYTTGNASTTNPQNTSLSEAEGKEYFAGIVCSHEGTAPNDYWKTGYYWPYQSTTNGYMHFHAFSPADMDPCAGTLNHSWAGGFTLANFVATDDLTKQVDLLYSNFVFDAQREQYTPNPGMPYDESTDDNSSFAHKGVNLVFNHALSSINFVLKTDKDYSTYHTFTIKELKVENVLKGGSFTENVTDDHTPGKYKNETGDYNKVTKTKNNGIGESPYWEPTITGSTGYANDAITYTLIDSSTGVEVTKDEKSAGNAILAVPQILEHDSHWSAIGDVKITGKFDYKFRIGTNEYVELTNVPFTKDLSGIDTYQGSSKYDDGNYWLINHRYTYTLNFKLDEIIFDPKVENWVEVTVNVDLP